MHGPPGNPGIHRKTYNHKDVRSARRKGIAMNMEQKIRMRELTYKRRIGKNV